MTAGWFALLGLTLAACRPGEPSGIAEARADELATGSTPNGVALVELFTSEGCSSCPPADSLLADLANTKGGVYVLAFHVDYWNDLGWTDRFASPEYTDRQSAYARSFGGRGLYTPQMIVNGTEQFTGSDRARAEQSIARALSTPAPVSLSIGVRAIAPDTIAIDCSAPGAPGDSVVDIAIVEHSTSTDVRAGENAGRVLRHTNVVRTFVVAAIGKQTASVVVHIPPTLRREDGEVIAYVQRPSGKGAMPVLGSARSALPR
jgi:hypothetical protein